MNAVCRDIFRAVHEEKWISIEYRNGQEEITKYWIGILDIDPRKRSMRVQGLHLARYTTMELKIYIDSILSSALIDGSYFHTPPRLAEEIRKNPERYQAVFGNVANLKILSYLSDCHRLDTTPYKTDYALIGHLDGDWDGKYELSPEQFREIVKNFQYTARPGSLNYRIKQLALNVLSVHTAKGVYVLAYRKVRLDVMSKTLLQEEEVTICTEFTINGSKYSIRRFLDGEDYALLEDFDKNAEKIKDLVSSSAGRRESVDDMPYLIAIGRDVILDLAGEYAAISKMYEKDQVTVPIKAFFGALVRQTGSRKDYPIALLNRQINLDQLLAIHNAMKYPLAYIQGPPGTGKTNTIVNTIITAFFNEKTVLFNSYNNHPIDGVCEKLKDIAWRGGRMVPFPVIRLGNDGKVDEALDEMRRLYEKTKEIRVYEGTLERNRDERIVRTRRLTELLRRHEEKLELLEKKEAIQKLMDTNRHLTFQSQLYGEQMAQVDEKLRQIGDITEEEARSLVLADEEEFRKYLYYVSAKYIRRLGEPKNEDLLQIIYSEDPEGRVKQFNRYIRDGGNLKKFQRIFPVIATTSISAHKLGEPEASFDMVIMDEASQGNLAVSLVPILRGRSLMLVGDPQQLSPVILLDAADNARLKKNYGVTDEYDYLKSSIYKTYLAADPVSGEILLSHHYRCNRHIIQFNNRKYYHNKLVIDSAAGERQPLVFLNVQDEAVMNKNTSPREAEEVVRFVRENPNRDIGVITPFVSQKELIRGLLRENGMEDVPCGTVHAFQGDEKDVVLFSLALTERTGNATYEWLRNNKELINVATSRAKNRLVMLSDARQLERLHTDAQDDLYELAQYVRTRGESRVTPRETASRALGIKPYSTETENAFLTTLNHALDNVLNTNQKCVVHKEVAISHVFQGSERYSDLFFTGRFDFVVYERDAQKREIPILAIELDGREHREDERVRERDEKKNEICKDHGFELIRVENSYARRYHYIKEILIRYFKSVKG